MSTPPLERAGAGSAVTSTVRQTGSVLGIAVGGTVMSITYRHGIEASLHDLPGLVQDRARVSAEQARQAATAIHRPDLAQARKPPMTRSSTLADPATLQVDVLKSAAA